MSLRFRKKALKCDHQTTVETRSQGIHRIVCRDCGMVSVDATGQPAVARARRPPARHQPVAGAPAPR